MYVTYVGIMYTCGQIVVRVYYTGIFILSYFYVSHRNKICTDPGDISLACWGWNVEGEQNTNVDGLAITHQVPNRAIRSLLDITIVSSELYEFLNYFNLI